MRYAFKTDQNDFVVGIWNGAGAIPGGRLACSPAQAQQYFANERYEGAGGGRWKFTPGGGLVEQADNRPLVRALINGETTETGEYEYEIEVGAAAGTLTLQAITEAGAVRTGINRSDFRLQLANFRLKLDIVAGEASINIPTGVPREVTVHSNKQMRLEAPFTISVIATEL